MDSAFGAGTSGHVLSTLGTTVEAIVFEAIASKAPRSYPDSLRQFLVSFVFAMFGFTWAVVVLEVAIPVGRDADRDLGGRDPPRLLLPLPSIKFSSSGSRRMPITVHVQPSTSSLVLSPGDGDSCSRSGSESGRIEEACERAVRRGGNGPASVVPIEG